MMTVPEVGETLISTIPVVELLRKLVPQPSSEIRQLAGTLSYRHLVVARSIRAQTKNASTWNRYALTPVITIYPDEKCVFYFLILSRVMRFYECLE